jgi:hypothetical protein
MSKLGCPCGNVIPDQTDYLPYKGHVLSDLHCDDFFEWVVEQTQRYLEATREGRRGAWLIEEGFKQDYIDLKLSDSEVLHDLIYTRFLTLKRDMYECDMCGRLHVQAQNGPRFVAYGPDNGCFNAVLDAPARE